MIRPSVLAASLVALVLAIGAAPASAALETIMQDDGMLLHSTPEDAAAGVARMKALGVDRVRVTANWSTLTRQVDNNNKPTKFDFSDPAVYIQPRFAALDNAVRLIRGAGMQVLMDVGFWAPHWATRGDIPGPRARTSIDPQAFADFAVALARRYSGTFVVPPPKPSATPAPPPPPTPDQSLLDQILGPAAPMPPMPAPPVPPAPTARAAQAAAAPGDPLPAVDEFVLWNEPNIPALLMPQWDGTGAAATAASPAIYRAMVQAAYPAMKAARPDIKVLIGNTSSVGGTRGSGAVAPLEFLRGLACVDRQLRPLNTPDCADFKPVPGDGWAHHPYAQNERPTFRSPSATAPDDVRLADLPKLAKLLDRLARLGRIAPADRDIYLTEFGYETQPVPGRRTITLQQQARWLTWSEYIASRIAQVKTYAQFLLRDQPPGNQRISTSVGRPNGGFATGLLNADGSDKPAVAQFEAGLFAQRRSHKRVLLYGRLRLGDGPRTLVVQRSLGPTLPWIAVLTIKADGRASFTHTVRFVKHARYRLSYTGPDGQPAIGLDVAPVTP